MFEQNGRNVAMNLRPSLVSLHCIILQKAEIAALGAQAPPIAQYPARGRVGERARKRAAYRLAQSIRYQQFYTVVMDAIEDVCSTEVPPVSSTKCI